MGVLLSSSDPKYDQKWSILGVFRPNDINFLSMFYRLITSQQTLLMTGQMHPTDDPYRFLSFVGVLLSSGDPKNDQKWSILGVFRPNDINFLSMFYRLITSQQTLLMTGQMHPTDDPYRFLSFVGVLLSSGDPKCDQKWSILGQNTLIFIFFDV